MFNNHKIYPETNDREICHNHIHIADQPHDNIDFQNQVCIKPWGHEFIVYQNSRVAIWFLSMQRGHRTSLHCHFRKDTHLIVVEGCAKIYLLNRDPLLLHAMDNVLISRQAFHGIEAMSDKICILEIEVFCNGLNFSDKNDLLRIQDLYQRESTGYQTSVELSTCLEKYDHWRLADLNGTSKQIGNSDIRLVKMNEISKISNSDLVVLINGQLNNSDVYLCEGSRIQHFNNPVNMSRECEFLHIRNYVHGENSKIIYNLDHLRQVTRNWHGDRTVLTSGCFDLVHTGHLHILRQAKLAGDRLVVCLSNDEQVRRLKGNGRPVNNYGDRIDLIKTIPYVDYVVLYDETDDQRESTLGEIMQIVNPSAWVKGSDYTREQILHKHPYLREIIIVDHVPDKSSTRLIDIIRND